MLKQLAHLSAETDGRYATEQELQFLKNYLQSLDQRISTYEKIRDAEAEIMDQTKAQIDSKNPNLFSRDSQDLSSIWRRDVSNILRGSAAAMLINDLDWLRDNLLLWHRTIVNANKTTQISQLTYDVLPEILNRYLTAKELKLVMPVLLLNQSILG